MSKARLLLAMPGQEGMAATLAALCAFDVGVIEARRFPDGESYIRVVSDVAGRDVDLLCTLARPDGVILPLLFAASTIRDLGARSVRLIAPYLAYMRQDTRFKPGEAVTSRTFAHLLSEAFDGLITIDPHLHRYRDLGEIYSIPNKVLHATDLLGDWIGAHIEAPLLIGPDAESRQWVSAIAARAGAPFVVLDKVRKGDRQVRITAPELDAWHGRTPILVDDVVATGVTLIEAAHLLGSRGFPPPVCVVVHALLSDADWPALSTAIARLVSTDTVVHASNAISVAPLLALAIADPELT